jgi:SAM-dependent methyltransferase
VSATIEASKYTDTVLALSKVLWWGRPAGIQIACRDGNRYRADPVRTSTTPLTAYPSWCMSWRCHGRPVAVPSYVKDPADRLEFAFSRTMAAEGRFSADRAMLVITVQRINEDQGRMASTTGPLHDYGDNPMNESHLSFLAGPEWATMLRTDLLPWLREMDALGDEVLEIGPGPGLTTDLLVELATTVTAVEIDADLAVQLHARLGDAVRVVHGDATEVPLPDNHYSAATCFSSLHHFPSAGAQDRLFARLHRALRPGGCLLGVEAIDSPPMRQAHIDDIYIPVDPETLPHRLVTAGFEQITVTRATEYQYRFTASKPLHAESGAPSTRDIQSRWVK